MDTFTNPISPDSVARAVRGQVGTQVLDWTEATLDDVTGWKAERRDGLAIYFVSEETGNVGVFARGSREWKLAGPLTKLIALEDFHRWHEAEIELDLTPGIVPEVEHFAL